VRKTEAAVTLLEDLLTIELLLASDVLGAFADLPRMGEGTSHVLKLVSETVATADPSPADIHQAVRGRLVDLETAWR
jgi:histidine ammonia-lyase